MGRALADAFPAARQVFAEADEALGEPLSRLIWDGPEDALMLTENTQPAILTASIAAYRVLESEGLASNVSFVAGHSLGEYSANVAAGTFSFADAVRTVRRRGRYMQEAVPVGTGAMSAILGLDADKVAQACAEAAHGEVVSPANLNGAGQVVIAGAKAAVERAGARAKELGAKRVVPLAGERAVPLRADEAGGGSSRTRAARACRRRIRACRSSRTSTRRRSATDRRQSKRSSGRCLPPCAGRTASGALRRMASQRMLRWVQARVLSGLIRKIHRDATVASVGAPEDLDARAEAVLAT